MSRACSDNNLQLEVLNTATGKVRTITLGILKTLILNPNLPKEVSNLQVSLLDTGSRTCSKKWVTLSIPMLIKLINPQKITTMTIADAEIPITINVIVTLTLDPGCSVISRGLDFVRAVLNSENNKLVNLYLKSSSINSGDCVESDQYSILYTRKIDPNLDYFLLNIEYPTDIPLLELKIFAGQEKDTLIANPFKDGNTIEISLASSNFTFKLCRSGDLFILSVFFFF